MVMLRKRMNSMEPPGLRLLPSSFMNRSSMPTSARAPEMAPARRIFEAPVHPYTRALFRAIPSTDPRRRSEGEILEGEVASNLNPPSGCPFHPRCPYRQPECAGEAPGLLPLKEEGEHLAACPVMAKSLGKE